MSNTKEGHILSKSTFIKGIVCHKSLWLYKHRPHLIPPLTAAEQHRFDQGTTVGMLAQQLFPGGVDATPASHRDYTASLELTRKLIAQGQQVVYEAAFQANGVLCALDILVKKEDGWHAFEVKSTSGSVHPIQIYDAALQYYVMEKAGLQVRDISIVHLNSDYERNGDVELDKLFKIESVYYLAIALQEEIELKIAELKKVARRKTLPTTKIGKQCTHPFSCSFRDYCWKNVEKESSILTFRYPRNLGERFAMFHSGTERVEQIQGWQNLKTPLKYAVECHVHKGAYLDDEKLRAFMGQVKYPVCMLDFETANFAIPAYQKSSPYEQVGFQYSIHKLRNRNATPVHRSYLADPKTDFREDFLKSLLNELGTTGTIFAYSAGFERSQLNLLALLFPQYAPEIHAVIKRIVDLAEPFRRMWWYDWRFDGKFSIKKVLPVIAPHLSYDALPISNGENASLAFIKMVEQPGTDWSVQREQLLQYCGLDTLGMVEIFKFLNTLV